MADNGIDTVGSTDVIHIAAGLPTFKLLHTDTAKECVQHT